MGNKEHHWRLHIGTFWNNHLISNSKRLGIFWGANQVSTLYHNQNLLPLISHVNTNLGCVGVFAFNLSPFILWSQPSALCLAILSLTFFQLFVIRKLSS